MKKDLDSPVLKTPREIENYLKGITRSIPDYPKPGIIFRDLTTIFQDRTAFRLALDGLASFLKKDGKEAIDFQKIVGIEARGFILAGALAGKFGRGVVLARKPGKLPFKKKSLEYKLEYGEDALEIHVDSIQEGDRVIVVDDLLATGGTAEAACKLVHELGGEIVRVLFLVELPDLKGRDRLREFKVESLISFQGT